MSSILVTQKVYHANNDINNTVTGMAQLKTFSCAKKGEIMEN